MPPISCEWKPSLLKTSLSSQLSSSQSRQLVAQLISFLIPLFLLLILVCQLLVYIWIDLTFVDEWKECLSWVRTKVTTSQHPVPHDFEQPHGFNHAHPIIAAFSAASEPWILNSYPVVFLLTIPNEQGKDGGPKRNNYATKQLSICEEQFETFLDNAVFADILKTLSSLKRADVS